MAGRTRGFWTGLLAGLALGAAAAVALALLYPLPAQPPELDDATLAPPGTPPAPADGAAAPEPQGLIRGAAPGALIQLPEAGAETGSPSLVPER